MLKLRLLWKKIISKVCSCCNSERVDLPSRSAKSNDIHPWNSFLKYCSIHPTAVIDQSSRLNIICEPSHPKIMVEVGADSHIFGSFVLQTEDSFIKIGKRCHIGSSHFAAADSIVINDDVLISWNCTFIDNDNHSLDWEKRQYDSQVFLNEFLKFGVATGKYHNWNNVSCKRIAIADKVWVSFNSIILKGVSLGEGSVIGAGSVVTKSTENFSLNAGNPARHIRYIGPQC